MKPRDADYTIQVYKGKLLLIETWHIGESSRDVEIAACKSRMNKGEVSHIVVTNHALGNFKIYAADPRQPLDTGL